MKISAFEENITETKSSDQNPPNATRFGSLTMFEEIQKIMKKSHDVLIFIHGFNVAWNDAVYSALALQEMLNSDPTMPSSDPTRANKSTLVVLFSWPSDGRLLFSSDGRSLSAYISDRKGAYESGCAVGRGILKLKDFLCGLRHNGAELCNQEFHLLCHSMGNYVLQSTGREDRSIFERFGLAPYFRPRFHVRPGCGRRRPRTGRYSRPSAQNHP